MPNHMILIHGLTVLKRAIATGISKKVVEDIMSNARFLPKVIEYDRFQPEFYEDTFTYKRSSKKIRRKRLYKKKKVIDKVEEDFEVERTLLALMELHLENIRKWIHFSAATLSFDKRRSEFLRVNLLYLNLVDKEIINKDILYGSWAGAFEIFNLCQELSKIMHPIITKIEL